MAKLVLFNKPFRVLSQFRPHEDKTTLAALFSDKSLRLAGRLDYDSEGLLLLTDDGRLAHRISDPEHGKPKTYLAQVEGEAREAALDRLRSGVELKDGRTRPADAERVAEPGDLWSRDPPVRYRASIPTSWIRLTLREGRNRQVRRMTAAVGLPTLRLIRIAVDEWELGDLQPGESRVIHVPDDFA